MKRVMGLLVGVCGAASVVLAQDAQPAKSNEAVALLKQSLKELDRLVPGQCQASQHGPLVRHEAAGSFAAPVHQQLLDRLLLLWRQ